MRYTNANSARLALAAGALGVLAFHGCTDEMVTDRGLQPSVASLEIVSGQGQSAQAGTELPNPLVVRVVGSNGLPMPNQIVNFQVVAGGGRVVAGAALTNASRIAQERWTLGSTVGSEQRLEAR